MLSLIWIFCATILLGSAVVGWRHERKPEELRRSLAIVCTVDGFLHAFDSDMKNVWSVSTGPPLVSSNSFPNRKGSSVIPTLDGGLLISSKDGGFKKTSLTAQELTESTPFVTHEGLMFSGSKRNHIIGVNVEDGSILYDTSAAGSLPHSLPSVPGKQKSSLWLGRLDYSLRAVDSQNGDEEFRFSFSELKPLMAGASDLPLGDDSNHNQSGTGDRDGDESSLLLEWDKAKRALIPAGDDVRPWQSIVSTPEGLLYFMDSVDQRINVAPIQLRSPAVSAFVVTTNNRATPLIRHILPVHYSLSNYQWRNKLLSTKPSTEGFSSLLSLPLLPSPEQEREQGPKPEYKSIVVVESSPQGGSESNQSSSFAMEAFHDASHQAGTMVAIADSEADWITPNDGQTPDDSQRRVMPHDTVLGIGKRRVSTPRLSSIARNSHIANPLGRARSASLPTAEDFPTVSAEPSPGAFQPHEESTRSIRGYYRIVHAVEDSHIWLPVLQQSERGNRDKRWPRTDVDGRRADRPKQRLGSYFFSLTPRHSPWLFMLATVGILALCALGLALVVQKFKPTLLHTFPLLKPLSLQLLRPSSPQASALPFQQGEEAGGSVESEEEVGESNLRVSRIGSLSVHDTILGYGSHGTVVFLGGLNGRPVAVKRMLTQFVHAADREISLLIRSDGHPNMVRYFIKEQKKDFVFLGLQLCEMSLRDFVDRIQNRTFTSISDVVRQSLLQAAEGLAHLHSLRIVHRDVKPHNILLASPTECAFLDRTTRVSQAVGDLDELGKYVLKISDMGLAKQLDHNNVSFSVASMNLCTADMGDSGRSSPQAAAESVMGTVGWQAPELILASRTADAPGSGNTRNVQGTLLGDELDRSAAEDSSTACPQRRTLAVDVFSLGCVMYFTLTMGEHPFGKWFEREANIVAGKSNLERLKPFPDAYDLVESMIHPDPARRPSCAHVCGHPFFWPAAKRLEFLLELSDRLEKEAGDSPLALSVEVNAQAVVGVRWDRKLDPALLDDVGKYRKYDVTSVRDLLRIVRNKRHHFYELSESLQKTVGSIPVGFWQYFEQRFPRLLLHCCHVVRRCLHHEESFASWNIGGTNPAESVREALSVSNRQALAAYSQDANSAEALVEYEWGGGGGGEGRGREEEEGAAAATATCDNEVALPEKLCESNVIIWKGGSIQHSLKSNGWWKSADHWCSEGSTSSSSRAKKGKSSHLIKATTDVKFRTRLCSHWESTDGSQCPMRKKGKCIFAHGPHELRVKDSRRDKWGRTPGLTVSGSQWLRCSGGEDVVGAARSIEKIRNADEMDRSMTQRMPSLGMLPSPLPVMYAPGSADMYYYYEDSNM